LQGRLPLQTLRADIEYGFTEAHTTYGVIGVKCWLYRGDILEQRSAARAGAEAAELEPARRKEARSVAERERERIRHAAVSDRATQTAPHEPAAAPVAPAPEGEPGTVPFRPPLAGTAEAATNVDAVEKAEADTGDGGSSES
jgi:small subunit ribosomal protein S3